MLGTWFSFVRRARLGPQRKMIALTLGSYANNDGTRVRCGVAALAVDCEIGYSTARRHLAWMRDHQFIELVKPGNARRGKSDEYRLILGPRAKELDVPEAEYEGLKDDLREANQAGQKVRRLRDQRSPMESANSRAEAADSPGSVEASALTQTSAENVDQRSLEARSALTHSEPPPPINTSHKDLSSQPGGSTTPRPPRPDAPPSSGHRNEQQKSINQGKTNRVAPSSTTSAARASPTHCPHGIRIRRRPDGTSNCAVCRREDAHAPPNNVIPFARPA